MTVEGADDLKDELNRLSQNAKELDGTNQVPLVELFNPSFMHKYTEFDSFEDMLEQSQWTVETQEDLEAIPEDRFDRYVREHTQFPDSEEMMGVAAEQWTADQMSL